MMNQINEMTPEEIFYKGKFWCTLAVLFYLEGIYLPVTKSDQ